MYDLKTVYGNASVSSQLLDSIGQSNRVLLNMRNKRSHQNWWLFYCWSSIYKALLPAFSGVVISYDIAKEHIFFLKAMGG